MRNGLVENRFVGGVDVGQGTLARRPENGPTSGGGLLKFGEVAPPELAPLRRVIG